MVLFLSENLMVAQSSGVNRDDKMLEQGLQAQATEVHTSFEGMGPNPGLKEQGSDVSEAALDTGDLNSNVTNQRFQYALKEQGSDVSEAALDTGDLNSNVTNQRFQYARGGYHGHGRGVPANFRGGQGMNRGQDTRTWVNVAATPDRFEEIGLFYVCIERVKLPYLKVAWKGFVLSVVRSDIVGRVL